MVILGLCGEYCSAGNTCPGSVLLVRDEERLVSRTERSEDGACFVDVRGVSELVRDRTRATVILENEETT